MLNDQGRWLATYGGLPHFPSSFEYVPKEPVQPARRAAEDSKLFPRFRPPKLDMNGPDGSPQWVPQMNPYLTLARIAGANVHSFLGNRSALSKHEVARAKYEEALKEAETNRPHVPFMLDRSRDVMRSVGEFCLDRPFQIMDHHSPDRYWSGPEGRSSVARNWGLIQSDFDLLIAQHGAWATHLERIETLRRVLLGAVQDGDDWRTLGPALHEWSTGVREFLATNYWLMPPKPHLSFYLPYGSTRVKTEHLHEYAAKIDALFLSLATALSGRAIADYGTASQRVARLSDEVNRYVRELDEVRTACLATYAEQPPQAFRSLATWAGKRPQIAVDGIWNTIKQARVEALSNLRKRR